MSNRQRSYLRTKIPEPESLPRSGVRRKKNKRWCRGKEGREHTTLARLVWAVGAAREYALECTVCGKRTSTWFKSSCSASPDRGPEWMQNVDDN